MKLTTVLSGFFTALSLTFAFPIVHTDSTDLLSLYKRGPDDTAAFNAFDHVHGGMTPGKQYVFTAKYDLPEKPDPNPKVAEAQRELGFCHITVLVVEISQKETGPPKNKKIQKDISGNTNFYHLIKTDKGDAKAEFKRFQYRPDQKMKLEYVKETKKTHAQRKAIGDDYEKAPGHQKYDAQKNNCNTYQENFVKNL